MHKGLLSKIAGDLGGGEGGGGGGGGGVEEGRGGRPTL